MSIYSLIKSIPIVRQPLLVVYHMIKNGRFVKFSYTSEMSHRCIFEGKNTIGKHAKFVGSLGLGSYVGDNSIVCAEIGRFSSIGPRCTYINATHPYKAPFVTTSPYFFSLDTRKAPDCLTFARRQYFNEFLYFDEKREIVNKIGNDCWLGSDVTLVGGAEISDGAVVLAHAVVTKDVPPYAIVGGVPAKILGYRYDDETIKELLRSKWWENDIEWFEQNAELLIDLEKFLEYSKKQK